MKRERDMVFLDVETTGTDPMEDRVVEVGLARLFPTGEATKYVWRLDPERPIPPEATAVHKLDDSHVKGQPAFKQVSAMIHSRLTDADYAGYNLRRLDLPILDEEFRRCGLRLPLEGARIIDCYGLWAAMAPRTLENAVQEFCGRTHEGAHGALADALATMDVLNGLLARWPQLAKTPEEELDTLGNFGRISADLSGKLYRDTDGDLRYGFGKVKDVKVRDDMGFGRWMFRNNFPGNTLEVLQAEFDRLESEARGKTLFPDTVGPYG